MDMTHSRESTRNLQAVGTMRPHLRAPGPARLQEGLGEEKLKPWTMNKRNRLSLRPRIHAADAQRRKILPLPFLVSLYRLERLTMAPACLSGTFQGGKNRKRT